MLFRPKTLKGAPAFIQYDDVYQIVTRPDDSGRWQADYLEPLDWGDNLLLLVRIRTQSQEEIPCRVVLAWLKNGAGEEIHSAVDVARQSGFQNEFKQHIIEFTVPPGVKLLQVQLRAQNGHGLFEFKDVRIEEKGSTTLPLPPLDGLAGDARPVSGYVWGDMIFLRMHNASGPAYLEEQPAQPPPEYLGEEDV